MTFTGVKEKTATPDFVFLWWFIGEFFGYGVLQAYGIGGRIHESVSLS